MPRTEKSKPAKNATCDATHRRGFRVCASLVVIPPTLHCLPSASLCLASWVAMTKRENEMNRCWRVEWQGSCLVPSVVQYGSLVHWLQKSFETGWKLKSMHWQVVFLCISDGISWVRIALASVQPSAGASGSASLDLTFKSFASLITVNLHYLLFIMCYSLFIFGWKRLRFSYVQIIDRPCRGVFPENGYLWTILWFEFVLNSAPTIPYQDALAAPLAPLFLLRAPERPLHQLVSTCILL